MSGPKRQHYVPRTYLKQFSFDDARNPHVYELLKNKSEILINGIENVALQKNFYTVNEGNNKYEWEEYYSKHIEPKLNTLLRNIRQRCENVLIQDKSVIISSEEKKNISECIVAQMFRGQPARVASEEIYRYLLPDMLTDLGNKIGSIDESMEQKIESYKHEDMRKYILMNATIKSKPYTLNALRKRIFVFLKINGTQEFISSDNPVMIMNSRTRDVTPFSNGLDQITTIVYYPLSPKIMLCAFHENSLWAMSGWKDCSLVLLDANKDSKYIDMLNQKQWEQCLYCVYSNTKNNLEKIQEYMRLK